MRRTKGEVIVKILETCLTGSNKTVIVYQSNLNFKTIVPYIDSLMKNELITTMDGKYKTTDKGKKLLARLKEVHELF